MSSIPIDISVFSAIHSATSCSGTWFDKLNLFVSNNSATIWLGLILLIALFNGKKGWYPFLMCLAGFILAWHLSDEYLKPLFNVPRPFLTLPDSCVYGYKPGTGSFPSGHMITSTTVAVLISLYNRKNIFLVAISLLLALFVGYTRMYLGVHFPSDILGGAIMGTIIAYVWYYATGWAAHEYTKK
jgi:undecaprenyl-diphosphatase